MDKIMTLSYCATDGAYNGCVLSMTVSSTEEAEIAEMVRIRDNLNFFHVSGDDEGIPVSNVVEYYEKLEGLYGEIPYAEVGA